VSLVVRVGQFLYYFGIVSAVLSLLVIGSLTALGAPVHGLLYGFARAFAFGALAGAILGVLSGKLLGAFIPQLSGSIRVWFVVTHFVPVYAPLVALLTQVLSMLPLRPEALAGLLAVVHGFAAFAILYYLAVQAGVAPLM